MKWYYNSRTFDSRPTGHTSHHITSQQLCDVCCALCIIPSDARLIGSNSNISSQLCGCPPSYSSHSSPLLSSSSTLRSVRRLYRTFAYQIYPPSCCHLKMRQGGTRTRHAMLCYANEQHVSIVCYILLRKQCKNNYIKI